MPPHNNSRESLSYEAAYFMAQKSLTIRNSSTKQLRSLHYGLGMFPETHTPGQGRYCVPLWTIAFGAFTQDEKELKKELCCYQNKAIERFGLAAGNIQYYRPPMDRLLNISPVEQKQILNDYLQKIKTFIRPYVPFGRESYDLYGYELLVGSPMNFVDISMDDLGRYSTGGRGNLKFDKNTICYRVTLNAFERNFINKVLLGTYDHKIPDIKEIHGKEVSDSARYALCNELCVEIIAAKLLRYLNNRGRVKNPICLNKLELEYLLDISLKAKTEEIAKVISNKWVSYTRARFAPNDFISFNKYARPKSKSVELESKTQTEGICSIL